MKKKRKLIISIISVLLLVVVVATATYAFIIAMTNEVDVDTGSGMLDIVYEPPGDITGTLSLSANRSGGLMTSTTARLGTDSEKASFNMYITPTALTNLNITALKWEAEGIRDGNVICFGEGDFSQGVVGEKIKILNGCELDYEDTTFNIYIWLDASLLETSLSGANFGAKIGADSVPITGAL